MARLNINRNYRDPSALTEYEQRIHTLRQQGKTWKEIGAALNNNPQSVMLRHKIIREKLIAQQA